MEKKQSHVRNIFFLICLSIVFFMLGNDWLSLTNPDEVFYSLSAKEMIQQRTWFVPHIFGQPQFEKPVFTFWLLRLSFCVFGITSFGARFPPAFFALLGSIVVYYLCQSVYQDSNKSFLCALMLISSALYLGCARFLLTDMIFSVLILMALTAFYIAYDNPQHKKAGILGFFIFAALAVLTKGLLGVALPVLIVFLFLMMQRNLKFIRAKATIYGVGIFLLIALPWYVFMIKAFGGRFIHEFFYNDHIRRILEAEHSRSDRWYFYPLTMMLGMLPWTVFVLGAFVCLINRCFQKNTNAGYHFLLSWILVVFVVFQTAHSKLASYIFPLMPALVIITGDYIGMLLDQKRHNLSPLVIKSLLLAGFSYIKDTSIN